MSTVTAGVQNKVTLRPFKEENITDEYLNWFKDKGFTRYLESKDITKQQALEHYRQCKTDGSFFYAIYDGDHVGNIKLNADNDLSIIIFPPYQGRGYATDAIRAVCETVKGSRITAGVRSDNIGSLKAFKKNGFTVLCITQDKYLLCK